MTYKIIEVANTHAGSLDYLKELIGTFASYGQGYGMKFQPLKPDELATKDFEWYPVYEQLFFSPEQWSEIITEVAATKDVWLDLFDAYGVQIVRENLARVCGIKFQTSVLFNYHLLDALAEVDLSEKLLIVNLAAQPLAEIPEIVGRIEKKLKPKEILIEVGFQAYPTALEDSGISKIGILRKQFVNRIVFADHTDGKSDDALLLPLAAVMSGADVIEKHVMLPERETKYDFYSSITPDRFKILSDTIDRYTKLKTASFINEKETEYLNKSIMIPLLKNDAGAGTGLDVTRDFDFKRSGKPGLNVQQIKRLTEGFHILAEKKEKGSALQASDFKKANIGAVVACRMKSSRLPKKAVLKLGELPSVELCLKKALTFQNMNTVVLATSTEEEDAILKDYVYSPRVKFYQGHPLDVMKRVLDVLELYELDVFVRITADMPYIEDEILQILLKAHFESGADYTRANQAAIGTNLEIINTAALKRLKEFFPSADYSEYMTYYFTNNPEHFRLNFIDLPQELIRDYRLTLDYEEDLVLFNKIEEHLTSKKINDSLRNVFAFLDQNPETAQLNSGMEVKYFTDKNLVQRIYEHTRIKR